ncbi:GNAT family N-acetyltransferase [Flavobacterium sp. GT3R68]|uniref:GNAT family N-acetyltransferase n=1 Tax=Flavobacterium sp. GT3R68 TaxID=2594437 RepID=UPI000F8998A4|nr:GNAT family N-acetyltransferase [Flavobacterium sp. GT3R68]RTY95053.1 GNAT family N-acetyltransferase [Flavobacterium sp. GSN2]TRW91859.1 GNAT family N-acetyltransferase [Flavobacterium sp. GT3R68]
MITITEATTADIHTIQQIAYQTWPDTYGKILSKVQLVYMLDSFYSEETLRDNMVNKHHHFLLAIENGVALGFVSYEHNYNQRKVTRIHKIYVLPETQGKGIGKLLLYKIEALAKENNSTTLSLNVNRMNKALTFYQKIGFEIVADEDIEIGHGYLMEDFVMEKQ